MTDLLTENKTSSAKEFPIDELRAQFPALKHAGNFVFFDNAAGAQIPRMVFDAVNEHLLVRNVQRGGRYAQSRAVDEMIASARKNVAAFVNAWRPEEISFGMNATSFIRMVSVAMGQSLQDEPSCARRTEFVLTELDHEANIATWLALERYGAQIRFWNARADGNLHLEDLAPLLSERTRLVACTVASNALGTIVDVRAVADLAHAVGAEVFLDCVHYGPHAAIDVRAFDCDYLVCSGYKIFGPHMGFLWGRHEVLRRLPTFREDFIPDEPPGKIEAGTFIFENVAGMDAAVNYLRSIGKGAIGQGAASTVRAELEAGLAAIRGYERSLSLELLQVLKGCGAEIYGITDPAQLHLRAPTVAFTLPRHTPAVVTQRMADADIGIRDGHMYAPRLIRRLGLKVETGVVRVSLLHYNTVREIHRFADVLESLC